MSCLKVRGGYRIRLKSGRTLPKVYITKAQCEVRVAQMEAHANQPKK